MTALAGPDPELTVRQVGARVRRLRSAQSLTLRQLSERTGLSLSMLSMIERGVAGGSIGTLVSIASALGVHMSDLFERPREERADPVLRYADQTLVERPGGAVRRILREDPLAGLEAALNEYEPGGASAPEATRHAGREFGVVLEGELVVELDGVTYELGPGDVIAYASTRPHRIVNETDRPVRAIWVNVDG